MVYFRETLCVAFMFLSLTDAAIIECPGTVSRVKCSSWSFAYEECIAPGIIYNATLYSKDSDSMCKDMGEGPSPPGYPETPAADGIFGFFDTVLWVNSGCRGDFDICHSDIECPGTVSRVECSSWNYAYEECPVQGPILYATVHIKDSISTCTYKGEGPSPPGYPQTAEADGIFGHVNGSLWVDSGCRGKFDICHPVSDPCIVHGDPHIRTNDGKHYRVGGDCEYYLIKHDFDTFSISGRFDACMPILKPDARCLKTLEIKYDGHVITLVRRHNVYIDGTLITPDFTTGDSKIKVIAVGRHSLEVHLENGVSVYWNGIKTAKINLPFSFLGDVKGLCGSFDLDQENDFMLPNGDVTADVDVFLNGWEIDGTC